MNVSNVLIKLDRFFDYFPVASTVTNLIGMIANRFFFPEGESGFAYFNYMNAKYKALGAWSIVPCCAISFHNSDTVEKANTVASSILLKKENAPYEKKVDNFLNKLLDVGVKEEEISAIKHEIMTKNTLTLKAREIIDNSESKGCFVHCYTEPLLYRVPDEICGLDKIEKIDLSGNNITKLPSNIWKLKNLDTIILHDNRLREIPGIENAKNLTRIDLKSNHLRKIPKEIGSLRNLKYLNVSLNDIKTLPEEIYELDKLLELNISGNEIKNLSTNIKNLSSLEVLDANYNELESIPSEIGHFKSLRKIDFSGNNLKTIPSAVKDLGNLEEFKLAFNHPLVIKGDDENWGKVELMVNLGSQVVRGL